MEWEGFTGQSQRCGEEASEIVHFRSVGAFYALFEASNAKTQ